jgi:hypothetical protein
MDTVQLLVGAGVGVVTAIVSYRALRDFSTFGGSSLPLAVCSGALAAIGVMGLGDRLVSLTIPWAALGIAICFLLVLGFVARLCTQPHHLGGTEKKPKSCRKSKGPGPGPGDFCIGTLLPPSEGEHQEPSGGR